ncbi:MAG: glycosyltransferase [Desulfosoma sp.]
MKILHYCQHVLGIGHFLRSMEIASAFFEHEVFFVEGGQPLPGFEAPPHVHRLALPALMMDPEFRHLETQEGDVRHTQEERKKRLLEIYQTVRPDVVLIELFPFGRKRFQFELIPLLEANRTAPHSAFVVCSLRDILVEKADPDAYEENVVRRVNRYFHLILVHADPTCVRLDETFSRVHLIEPPMVYTGYVTRTGPNPPPPRLNHRIVLSTGGGRVGIDLIQAVCHAFSYIFRDDLRLEIYEGPFMTPEDKHHLQALTSKDFRIAWKPFTPHFLKELFQAGLSISMAGYNTCMDVLSSGVKALVYPFPQNREQALRAERLASRGALRVLRSLDAKNLAVEIQAALDAPPPNPLVLKTDGAQESVRAIEKLILKA